MVEDGNNKLTVWDGDGSTETCLASNIDLNVETQYFVTFTWSPSGRKLYINGQEVGSSSRTVPIGIVDTAYIGEWYGSTSSHFNGLIDDLRISNRARTLDEHQAAYLINQPLPVDADTTLKVSFDSSLDVNIPVINYVYDSLNRLNTIVTPKKTINYQYDGNGNLIQRTINQ